MCFWGAHVGLADERPAWLLADSDDSYGGMEEYALGSEAGIERAAPEPMLLAGRAGSCAQRRVLLLLLS
jgi:hypothetical protein